MDKAGVLLDSEGNTTPSTKPAAGGTSEKPERSKAEDEKLAVFRDFINSLDMDDLGKPNQNDE
jgi:hypothetical protein